MFKRHRDIELAHTVSDFHVCDDVKGCLIDGRVVRGNVVAIKGGRVRVVEYFGGPEHLLAPSSVEHL